MKQLNLTIYGETDQEILFYLLKAAQKLKGNVARGRIEEVRPARGTNAIVTMAKFSTSDAWKQTN